MRLCGIGSRIGWRRGLKSIPLKYDLYDSWQYLIIIMVIGDGHNIVLTSNGCHRRSVDTVSHGDGIGCGHLLHPH